MNNGNTKYRKTYNLKATIFSILFMIIFTVFLVYRLLHTDEVLEIIVCLLFLTLIIFNVIGAVAGALKGRMQIAKENKYIKKTNPDIYYRELPNNFGIGVASLLFDSTIENYKDIVAEILDLCARKYLNLIKQNDKYIIQILKPVDDNLLSNEKYILNLVINNDIKNINYHEWYNYCMQDGIDLGLYSHRKINVNNEPSLTQDKIKKRRKIHLLISIIIGILSFMFLVFEENIIRAAGYGAFYFILAYAVLIVPFYLINVFTGFKDIGKQAGNINYKNIIENNLLKTEKGIEELQKLYSFKAFINDFGNFVDKKAEEVVLWDRYLSYAQVFGLTKEIMNSGYKELVDNSSFQIDNIDNINLSNIEVNIN